jgi:hypothetical protein
MIHYLYILHSEDFNPLLDNFLAVSSTSVVQFDKIVVISVEPFSFTTIDANDLGVQFIDFFLQTFNSALLTDPSLFRHLFFILFDFFDLIFHICWFSEHLFVNQSFKLFLQRLLLLVEFVKSFHFGLFNLLNLLLELSNAIFIYTLLVDLLAKLGDLVQQLSYFIVDVLLVEF